MERKLITTLLHRKFSQTFNVELLPPDFVAIIQKAKEFKDLSLLSIGEIYKECELVELMMGTPKDRIMIDDPIKMDFFYLIKGDCKLNFEVLKIYD